MPSFSSHILRRGYTCLLFMLACFYIPWRLLRAFQYRHGIAERFGFIRLDESKQNAIWIQAVSVGETMASVPLINQLRHDYPTIPLLLSNTTITGAARSKKLYPELPRIFFPWDFRSVVRRTLRRMRPRMLILIETELWPNLIEACADAEVPVLLLNARMSSRSVRRYMMIKPLSAKVLGQISAIAAQTATSAKRFQMLGANPAKISVCGNLKFDMDLSSDRLERASALRQTYRDKMIWVAGSTHAGEEAIILEAASVLWKRFPTLLLVLAPRHPERFNKVIDLCKTHRQATQCYSDLKKINPLAKILVLDKMGVLEDFLAAADVAFIGGSLMPVGGHNMFEATAYGVPVLCGPHLFNFESAAKLLLAGGGLSLVYDSNTLIQKLSHWLGNALERIKAGQSGALVTKTQRGALEKHMRVIRPFLNKPS